MLRVYGFAGSGSGRVAGWHGCAGLHRDGRWLKGGSTVMMPERQNKLDRKREQRKPRSVFDVRPEPLHSNVSTPSRYLRCYNITSGFRPDVNGDLLGRPKDVVAKCETVWFVQRITGVDWSSASFPKPGCGKGAQQQQQADHSGEHRQHADAADHAGVTNPHAQPALAAKHA
jgi:hypothetical protein